MIWTWWKDSKGRAEPFTRQSCRDPQVSPTHSRRGQPPTKNHRRYPSFFFFIFRLLLVFLDFLSFKRCRRRGLGERGSGQQARRRLSLNLGRRQPARDESAPGRAPRLSQQHQHPQQHRRAKVDAPARDGARTVRNRRPAGRRKQQPPPWNPARKSAERLCSRW